MGTLAAKPTVAQSAAPAKASHVKPAPVVQRQPTSSILDLQRTIGNQAVAQQLQSNAGDARHARGFSGEQGMGFIHYRQEDGWFFVEGPSGASGHGVTQSGFDAVACNVRTGEIHLIDNKSLAREGNVGSAPAIDPSRNLGKNLDGLIQRVEAMKDVPERGRLIERLRALKAALVAGKPPPQGVKLVVTGVGGKSTGVTERLRSQGVEFRPEPAPKNQPGTPTPARPPTAPAAPAAPVRPTSAWRAGLKGGLKAGGKALAVMAVFAGLDYLVRKRLETDLDDSIHEALVGARPWAQRVKRDDPSKPVFMRVKVEAKDYSRYMPLVGWVPEAPVLHMIQIMMVREEIVEPIVVELDERLDLWRPGVTTTVTYTEPMLP